jgi:lipopolysaccharide transport system permease protein
MMNDVAADTVKIIKQRSGWRLIDFQELIDYRDLLYFLVTREIKVLYAQTILGLSWAIIQPLVQIIIFSIVFGKVAKVASEGVPYLLFTTVAIIPWTYMSQSMTASSESLVKGQNMLGKVYFPRLIYPAAPVFARLMEFFISLCIIACAAIYYKISPTLNLLLLPLFIIYMMMVPIGIGLWLSSLAIRFRDVKHAMPFVIRMLLYTAPIVYSAASIPEHYRILYCINPIVGVIEGFRACFLGTPIPWMFIWPGMLAAVIILVGGAFYFVKMERVFVDVI